MYINSIWLLFGYTLQRFNYNLCVLDVDHFMGNIVRNHFFLLFSKVHSAHLHFMIVASE